MTAVKPRRPYDSSGRQAQAQPELEQRTRQQRHRLAGVTEYIGAVETVDEALRLVRER